MGEIAQYTDLVALGGLVPPTPLLPSHDLSRFDCGKAPLNDWLRHTAGRLEGRSARCYVLAQRNSVVIGFYCLSPGAVHQEGAQRKARQKVLDPTAVVTIGRLAVDKSYQGQGLGRALLKDALRRVIGASDLVGARAVVVHAVDHEAIPFYARYGFRSLPMGSQTLFLPIDEVILGL
jgi:GNAT superfamily N-acetyltransferase